MPTPVKFPPHEIRDIDMADSSPSHPSPDKDKEKDKDDDGERALAVGALRRVYKRRTGRERSQVRRHRSRVEDEDSSAGESDGEEDQYAVTQKTTNHYTLNMATAPPPSDLPFRLLG